MRKLLFAIILVSISLAPSIWFAYSSNVCTAEVGGCTRAEVGPFMQDISKACGNLGDCSLADIMMVFDNVGLFILSIIGGVVLLMYVVGGFYMLISGGSAERVKKGKKYLTISTIGLLIVMFAWTGVRALNSAIRYGTVYGTGDTSENFTSSCTDLTIGWDCGTGVNETCTESLICETACRQLHPDSVSDTTERTIKYYDCVNTSGTELISDSAETVLWFDRDSCATGLCPGNKDWLCCEVNLGY